jgi:hypothetical protein
MGVDGMVDWLGRRNRQHSSAPTTPDGIAQGPRPLVLFKWDSKWESQRHDKRRT